MKTITYCLLIKLITTASLCAATFYVAPDGNDGHPGTQAKPFLTLGAAQKATQAVAGKEAVTITVADGIYYLPETLVFTHADSGAESRPVIYQSQREGGAIISGGLELTLDWQPYRDGIQMARTPEGLDIDQVFVNGARQRMARYPNYNPEAKTTAYQGSSADAFSKERAAGWKNPKGGYIHAMHRKRWGGYHYKITGKDEAGEVTYKGGWQNNRPMGMHESQRMVENIFEELDAAGEWYHNKQTHTLYYHPNPDEDLRSATVEVVRLAHLIELKGTEEEPVHHVQFKGFTFRHTSRTFMKTKEPLLRSDWAIYRGGVIKLTGTEHISILDSEFDQPGGNAIFFSGYNRDGLVKGCHIHHTGASGVCFVGLPSAVRDPLFLYHQKQRLLEVDRTPGPKSNDYPANCIVEDCLITDIGIVERQPAGVQISMSARITVRDCSIYDTARAGINISEGAWGGHLIERVDVFDTVLETHDHGSFNSWGRDRFWVRVRGMVEEAVAKVPELPLLDAVETTIIRDSRWRCDHGWDVDLDDGSSNYEIYNNLMLNRGLKLREGYRRHAYNNVIINNGLHAHVWYLNSDSSFERNIVSKAHRKVSCHDGWAEKVDHNFFTDGAALRKSQAMGAGANSIAGDPMFVDPANYDFRVKEDSPALKVGFKNFPMDQFGVKKPALKAIARKPQLPIFKAAIHSGDQQTDRAESELFEWWMGAKIRGITGEEFSAFGVSKEESGIYVAHVLADSEAASAGFKYRDLIQKVNGKPTRNTPELFQALASIGDAPLEITVIRDQSPVTLKTKAAPIIEVEQTSAPNGFKTLKPGTEQSAISDISAEPQTTNEAISSLTDGNLQTNYGPVFNNGTNTGIYKIKLNEASRIQAVRVWTYNKGGKRSALRLTIYGSHSETDPGWKVGANKQMEPIGSIDTTALKRYAFEAASLRTKDGKDFGTFRWVLIQAKPISPGGEHTAFQEIELSVR